MGLDRNPDHVTLAIDGLDDLRGPGVTTQNETALWFGTGNQYAFVARAGSQAPGVATGINFGSVIGRVDSESAPSLSSAVAWLSVRPRAEVAAQRSEAATQRSEIASQHSLIEQQQRMIQQLRAEMDRRETALAARLDALEKHRR